MSNLTSSGRASRRARSVTRHQSRAALFFVAPFFALFVAFLVAPICFALFKSLFKEQRSGLGYGVPEQVFVGFENYLRAFSDPSLIAGATRLGFYVLIAVPALVGIGLLLALLLDVVSGRFKAVYRLAIFLPYAVPGVIAALMWGYLYEPQLSPFLHWLELAGISIDPLASSALLGSIVNVNVWQYAGYNMIIFVAALQAVPTSVYEAARLDGAGELRMALQIKLPMIAPAVILSTVFTLVGSLQLFNEPLIFRPLSPAIGSDFTPNLYAYSTAFARNDYNYGSTLATVIALATIVISFAFLRVFKSRSGLGVR